MSRFSIFIFSDNITAKRLDDSLRKERHTFFTEVENAFCDQNLGFLKNDSKIFKRGKNSKRDVERN